MISPPIVQVRPPDVLETAIKTGIPTSPTELNVSADNLPEQVRKSNLSLVAARQLVAEAQGELKGAGLESNPELEVGFETNQRFHEFMLTVGISKKFPRTNRLFIEKEVSQILIEAAQAEVRDAERLIIGQARLILVEVLALRQKKSLIAYQEENARKLTEFIEQAAVKGEASLLDAGVALLEATRLENRAKQIEIKEILAMAKLRPLLGMEPEGKLIVTGVLTDPQMPMMNVTRVRRPDLEVARLRARSATAATDLARSTRVGDLEAGLYAGLGRSEDAPDGFEREHILGVRFKIPLGDNPRTVGDVIASDAKAARLAIGSLALEQLATAEAHAAYAEMQEWQLLAEQIKTRLLPLADEQIRKTEEARATGQVALREVLLAKEQKLDLQTSYLEAVRDFHLAYANYLTATSQ